ncbi:hypothetical protein Cs7R123_63400 [Catellatospora sp. TT07R-123]|uniref:hypothetical protein n=1 Tax=Catellatospora sp. TT07R-123 TaxID=2733863 RepID=UPI001B1C8987|nr:hypothetical protein [Catellatospora sp. TT07R-123]GHJ48998.1 hypothetical protein Cs7R123_63400 [Catellatospora sp. TT07R-123]
MTSGDGGQPEAVQLRADMELTHAVQALLPERKVVEEVASADEYLWMALVDKDRVLAAHRALLANRCVYLRAAFAFDQDVRFPTYRLAKAIIGRAEQSGLHRAHVWVETRGQEGNMARLLGVLQSTTPLHRYRLPQAACLRPAQAQSPTDADLWVRDGRCLVSHPSFGADGLPGPAVSRVPGTPPAHLLDEIDEIEVALPAFDINAAFDLRGRGARRMSRVPVMHGIVNLRVGS